MYVFRNLEDDNKNEWIKDLTLFQSELEIMSKKRTI